MLVDIAFKAIKQRETVDREAKGGSYAVGSSHTSGSNPAPFHQLIPTESEDLAKALKLLWFFLPDEEPFDPHTRNAKQKEINSRWHSACELYQKYVGGL